MPNGRIHSITTITLAAGAGLAAAQLGAPPSQVLALAGGTLTGLLLTPDLDVDRGSISHHNARRLGGDIFGLLWTWLWLPYALVIRHRSALSHAPILGTILRLGYLVLVGWLLLQIFHLSGVIPLPALPVWWPWTVVGLMLSDLLHYVLDQTIR